MNKIYTLNDPSPTIKDLEYFPIFQREFLEYIQFFEGFSDMFSDRCVNKTLISDKGVITLDCTLIDSAANSLKCIMECCAHGAFSDANTLVRKLRDDLLLFAYLLEVIDSRNVFSDSLDNDDEVIIHAWFSNSMDKLPKKLRGKLKYDTYMKRLKNNKHISTILSKYNLEHYWDTHLRTILNDYVHNNGISNSYQNIVYINNPNIKTCLQNINYRVSFVSSLFLVLLIMIDSSQISSSDYVDYLDIGQVPPENSQYWVAGLIQEFIDKRVVKLHPELKQYLIDNNKYGMEIK